MQKTGRALGLEGEGHVERTLVLVKPDGVRRGLSCEVLARLERSGMKLIGLKMVTIDREFAERHYTWEDIGARHGDEIRSQLLDYITEDPVVAAVFEAVSAVANARKLCGSTEPASAAPGTIRGDYCHETYSFANDAGKAVHNLLHASATLAEAKEELSLWFEEGELQRYRRSDEAEHLLDKRSEPN